MPVKKDFCATEIILDIHRGMSPEECIAQFEIDNDSPWLKVDYAIRCAGFQAACLGQYAINEALEKCCDLIKSRALSPIEHTGGSHEPVQVA